MPRPGGEIGAGADDFPRLTESQLHDVVDSLGLPRSSSPHVARGVVSALLRRAAALRRHPEAGTIDQRAAFDDLSAGLRLTMPEAAAAPQEPITGVVGSDRFGMGDSPAALAAENLGLTMLGQPFSAHRPVQGDG